jgi:hypothetical protein
MRTALLALLLLAACSDPADPPAPESDPPAWVGVWHAVGPTRVGLDRTRHWATLKLLPDSTAEWGECYRWDYALEQTVAGGTYSVSVYGGAALHLKLLLGNSPSSLAFAWEGDSLWQPDIPGHWQRME